MIAIMKALRLESASLKITVVTVKIGVIKINTLASGINFKISTTSRYKSIEKNSKSGTRQ